MIAAVGVGVGAVGVTVAAQALGWLGEQLLLVSGLPRPAWLWPAVGLLNALLVGVPAGLLAGLPRSAAVRATGRAWLLGAITLAALSTLRAIPPTAHEAYLAAFATTAVLATLLIRRFGALTTGTPGHRAEPTAILLGVAAGLALLLPWVWVGALGGTLETVLALLATPAGPTPDLPQSCGAAGNLAGAGLVDAYAAVRAAQQLAGHR